MCLKAMRFQKEISMKQFYNRLLLLTWGLFLYALGIVVALNANIARFENAPEGFHPKNIFSKCKSVIVFIKQMPFVLFMYFR